MRKRFCFYSQTNLNGHTVTIFTFAWWELIDNQLFSIFSNLNVYVFCLHLFPAYYLLLAFMTFYNNFFLLQFMARANILFTIACNVKHLILVKRINRSWDKKKYFHFSPKIQNLIFLQNEISSHVLTISFCSLKCHNCIFYSMLYTINIVFLGI